MQFVGSIGLITNNLAPAIQAGVLPPEVLTNTLAKAFELFRQDPTLFEGPLGELAGSISSSVSRQGGGSVNPSTSQSDPAFGGGQAGGGDQPAES